MKFNASMLKNWQDCQLKGHFAQTEDRPRSQHAKASFGTIIHHCLDLYNWDGDLDLAKDRFIYYWTNPEELGVTPTNWGGVKFGSLRERGLKILDEYHQAQQWEPREVVATEHKFCVPIGDHLVSGIVDLLEYKKSGRGLPTLKIVDYKTNSKQPTINDLRLDIQFTIYFYASLQPEFWLGYVEEGWHPPMVQKYPPMVNGEELMERFANVPRRAAWYHLWGNKEIDAGDRDVADFERLYTLMEAIAKANEFEVFVPSIRADSCLYCDYKDICPSVIPVLDKLDVAPGGEEDDNCL